MRAHCAGDGASNGIREGHTAKCRALADVGDRGDTHAQFGVRDGYCEAIRNEAQQWFTRRRPPLLLSVRAGRTRKKGRAKSSGRF